MKFEKVVALCAATFIFFPSLQSLFIRWQEPVSYFDHAVIVPPVCAWMFFRSKDSATTNSSGTKVGFFLLIFALFLQWIGELQQITFLQGTALVLAVWGAALALCGTQFFKQHRWPLLYLLLLIPVPTFFMAQLTLGMRELSTTLAAGSLHTVMTVLGLPFLRVGNELKFAGHQVTIVDACSGMNTLLTVIAIGLVLIYLETSRVRQWTMAALLIPTAIIANLFRILVLCVFVALGQGEFAFGAGHAAIGMTTVGVAIAILAFGIRLPCSTPTAKPIAKPAPVASPSSKGDRSFQIRLASLTAVLIVGALISITIPNPNSSRVVTIGATTNKAASPNWNFRGWDTKELPLDAATYEIVGTHDAHMYRFDRSSSAPVFLYWVHSGNSRKIGHPPELCYRSDGFEISKKLQTFFNLGDRTIPINRLVVQRGDYRLLVYYWYRIGGVATASYLEQQLRWAWNEIKHRISLKGSGEAVPDGTMIRVSTKIDNSLPDDKATQEAEKRLGDWVKLEETR